MCLGPDRFPEVPCSVGTLRFIGPLDGVTNNECQSLDRSFVRP